MLARGQEFKPLVSPSEKKPRFDGGSILYSLLRDNFQTTTWLCFGAFAQTVLFVLADKFAVGRLALIPAALVLAYRTLDAYLMSIGWKHNIYMDGIIQKKYSTAFPDELGHYGNKPAKNDIVVFLIGTRSNHPMGMFAPGVKDINEYFGQMAKDLDKHADEFGFLGMTSWLNSSNRKTNNEIMQVCYFRSVEGLHKFAHSEYHRKGWDWWNKNFKSFPYMSIYHETYHVPKGNWESIYVNSHVSGLNATTHKFTDEMTGQEMYASPIVDASKGLLKTSAGRMARSNATEHDKYDEDPYQNQ